MKVIAFYLPQFHPIPENDAWWGKGFTEWVNVAKAKPHFRGHYQPHIPADLGFYDLRLEDTRIAQAELAKQYGITAFCYYHYWFNGKMLLERPFNEVLASGAPDFPFCLCWANENWSRAWDGRDKRILMKQEYNETDRINHIEWLCKAFRDRRYIKIADKPLLLIYRTDNIADLEERVRDWRTVVKKRGFPGLYLCAVRNNFDESEEQDIIERGFDAIVEFQPYGRDFPRRSIPAFLKMAINNIYNKLVVNLGIQSILPLVSENNIFDYAKLALTAMKRPHPSSYVKFPCVMPSWDNSARKRQATIIQNDDAAKFQEWALSAFEKIAGYRDEEKIIFINAWNEWAEGCHMEPDQRNGTRFLNALRKALAQFESKSASLDRDRRKHRMAEYETGRA